MTPRITRFFFKFYYFILPCVAGMMLMPTYAEAADSTSTSATHKKKKKKKKGKTKPTKKGKRKAKKKAATAAPASAVVAAPAADATAGATGATGATGPAADATTAPAPAAAPAADTSAPAPLDGHLNINASLGYGAEYGFTNGPYNFVGNAPLKGGTVAINALVPFNVPFMTPSDNLKALGGLGVRYSSLEAAVTNTQVYPGQYELMYTSLTLEGNLGLQYKLSPSITTYGLLNLGYGLIDTFSVAVGSSLSQPFDVNNHYYYGTTLGAVYQIKQNFGVGLQGTYNRHDLSITSNGAAVDPFVSQTDSGFNEVNFAVSLILNLF